VIKDRQIGNNDLGIRVELLTDLVFLVGIGWYFPGIHHTDTKGKLSR
jgi:hypothetical protein